MDEEKAELRITTRLAGEQAAQLRELSARTGEDASALVRKALRRYHAQQAELLQATTSEPSAQAVAVPLADTAVGADEAVPASAHQPQPVSEEPLSPALPAPLPTASRRPSAAVDYAVGVRILTAPFDPASGLFDDEALQRFLLNKRVRRLVPSFFTQEDRAWWSVWVEYEPLAGVSAPSRPAGGQERSLDPLQRRLYDRLAAWRKAKAEASGVPVFVVATNRELADLARQKPRTLEALRQVKGFGKAKVERHGRELIALVGGFLDDGAAAGAG